MDGCGIGAGALITEGPELAFHERCGNVMLEYQGLGHATTGRIGGQCEVIGLLHLHLHAGCGRRSGAGLRYRDAEIPGNRRHESGLVFRSCCECHPLVREFEGITVAGTSGHIDCRKQHLVTKTDQVIGRNVHGESIVNPHLDGTRLGDTSCTVHSLDLIDRRGFRGHEQGWTLPHRLAIHGPVESVGTARLCLRRQRRDTIDTDDHVFADRDTGRLGIRKVIFGGVGTPRLVGDLQGVAARLQIVEYLNAATVIHLLEDPTRIAQHHIPWPLCRRLTDGDGNQTIGDEARGILIGGLEFEAGNHQYGIRGRAILQPDGFHESDILRRCPVKLDDGGL